MRDWPKNADTYERVRNMAARFREDVQATRRPSEPEKPKETLKEFMSRMNAPLELSDELKKFLGLSREAAE